MILKISELFVTYTKRIFFKGKLIDSENIVIFFILNAKWWVHLDCSLIDIFLLF